MNETDLILRDLVESFYRQKPRPPTAVVFKMKLNKAVEYLKSKGIDLPNYDQAVAEYQAKRKEQSGAW